MYLYSLRWALLQRKKAFDRVKIYEKYLRFISKKNGVKMCNQSPKTGVSLDDFSEEIILNKNENSIKSLLLQVAEECKRLGKPVTLRFAGGWVRDKVFFSILGDKQRSLCFLASWNRKP